MESATAAARAANAAAERATPWSAVSLGEEEATRFGSMREAWNCRPDWVRATNSDIHYLMGMVGITARFNDNATCLEELLTRLDECATWAEENKEFLSSN